MTAGDARPPQSQETVADRNVRATQISELDGHELGFATADIGDGMS